MRTWFRFRLMAALLVFFGLDQGEPLAANEPVAIVDSPVSGHVHPSICRTREGDLVVVFQGRNTLMVSRSTDQGTHWTPPVPIGTTAKRPEVIREVKRFEIYPGTTDALPDGRILVTWNYIADDKATDGYYERALLYTSSADGGKTWEDQKLIGPLNGKHLGAVRHNVLPWSDGRWLLPLRVGPPRLFDPRSGKLEEFPLEAPDGKRHEFQQIIRTESGTLLAMGPVLLRSSDDGKSWSLVENFPVQPAERDNLEGRFLTALSGGRVLITWGVGRHNKGLRYTISFDDGKTWSRDLLILLPETPIAARYYSGRTLQLDDDRVGTVFMNQQGVFFLEVGLDRFAKKR